MTARSKDMKQPQLPVKDDLVERVTESIKVLKKTEEEFKQHK